MTVEVRFHAGLDDLLPPGRRGRALRRQVEAGTTVKDLAESLGVPHTEIDVILVNGDPVGFGRQVADGDRVGVYPATGAPQVAAAARLHPAMAARPRFVLDVHLGRLARLLRLLGFDAVWRNDLSDEELAAISVGEGRTLLTRDRGVLKRAAVTDGYLVRETVPRRQLVEVLRRSGAVGAVEPFGRCLACNGVLVPVAKAAVLDRLPPRTRRDHHEFRRCPGCGRVYWRGSHYDRLAAVVADVLAEMGRPPPGVGHPSS